MNLVTSDDYKDFIMSFYFVKSLYMDDSPDGVDIYVTVSWINLIFNSRRLKKMMYEVINSEKPMSKKMNIMFV